MSVRAALLLGWDYASAMSSSARIDHATEELAGAAASATAAGVAALLSANALLRIGAVSAALAVQFDLSDLAGGHPSGLAVGLVGAAQPGSEMVFAPLLARLADRFGRRLFLVGGPLLGVLGMAALTLSVMPLQVGLSRLLEGVGAAAFVPASLGTIAAATNTDRAARARASGAFEGSTLIGYAGGFATGPFLYHALHRTTFPVIALFYLVAAGVVVRFVREAPPLPVTPLRVVFRALVGPGPVRTFIPAWLSVNALVGALYFNLGALLKRNPVAGQTLVHGWDERVIGVFLLTWAALLVAGIVLWTPTLRRLGGPLTMRRAVPGAVMVLVAMLVMNHLPLVVTPVLVPLLIAGVLIQAGFGPAAVNYLADCSEAFAADRSALMAFYTVTLAGGGAVGALLGGLVSHHLYLDGLVFLSLGLTGLAWVALGRVIRAERQLAG